MTDQSDLFSSRATRTRHAHGKPSSVSSGILMYHSHTIILTCLITDQQAKMAQAFGEGVLKLSLLGQNQREVNQYQSHPVIVHTLTRVRYAI